jgi:hypothetical protein
MMKATLDSVKGSGMATTKTRAASRFKAAAFALLLGTAGFALTGCYDDPHYYGHRSVRTGYYASYGAPGPYYGYGGPYAYDPYYGGYGYGSGIGIGVSSYRSYSRYGRRPYYRRGGDGRWGYRRSGDGRRYDRRDWGGRRRSGDRNRWERRSSSRGGQAIRQGAAPVRQEGAPIEEQRE